MAEKQQSHQNLIYIENKRVRQTKLSNTVENIRKQVCVVLMKICYFLI